MKQTLFLKLTLQNNSREKLINTLIILIVMVSESTELYLEEVAVRRYLMWQPFTLEGNILDEFGNIKNEIKKRPGYKRLIDALLDKGNQVLSLPEDDTFRYAMGYSEGLKFREKFGEVK